MVMARRRMRWGVSLASMVWLKRWEIAEGRAESSNRKWAVEEIVSVCRPGTRRGRELLVSCDGAVGGGQSVVRVPMGGE